MNKKEVERDLQADAQVEKSLLIIMLLLLPSIRRRVACRDRRSGF